MNDYYQMEAKEEMKNHKKNENNKTTTERKTRMHWTPENEMVFRSELMN